MVRDAMRAAGESHGESGEDDDEEKVVERLRCSRERPHARMTLLTVCVCHTLFVRFEQCLCERWK